MVFIIIILTLMVQSFKFLRQVQQQEAAAKKRNPPERQLHPKLQQQDKKEP